MCTKFGHSLVYKPPFNREYARNNKILEENWKEDNQQIQEFLITKCNPLLDKKGSIITSMLKNPTYQDELVLCHCALRFYDSKTKRQYPAGKCPVCILCSCTFVCTKK